MRVLQIAPFVDPKIGGQESHMLNLAKTLTNLGHDVTVLTTQTVISKQKKGIVFVRLKSINFFGLRLFNPFELFFLLTKGGFDICHLHHQTIFGEMVLLINKIVGLPTVTTLHTSLNRTTPVSFFYDKLSLKLIGNLSAKVICLTPSILDILKKRGLQKSKCIVIPNAVTPCVTKSLKFLYKENMAFDVLFVGRLEERKGILVLLDSFELLKQTHKNYTLKIVGNGPLMATVQKKIAAKGLNNSAEVKGYISKKELWALYSHCRVLVIPSFYEGLPTVALEAMMLNKPIIASDIPGLNDLIVHRKNGLLVNPADISELSLAIDKLLSNQICLNSIGAINNAILPQYSWVTVGKKISAVYNETILDKR